MRLRLAILGCGAVTQHLYLPALKTLSEEIEVTALCDTARESGLRCASAFPSAEYFSNFHELIEKTRPDAALIALPNALHAPVAIELLDSGIDVLCEKPIATCETDGEQMRVAANRNGRILLVGLYKRYFPAVVQIRRVLHSRLLGPAVSFAFSEGVPFTWPVTTFSMFDKRLSGGGTLLDAGAHTLDILQWWLGDITDVQYFDDACPGGIECDCMAKIQLGSQLSGTVRMSRSLPLRNVYRVDCTEGSIEWDFDNATEYRLYISGPDRISARCIAESGPDFLANPLLAAFRMQLLNLVAVCRGRSGSPDAATAEEACKTVGVIGRCYSRRQRLATSLCAAHE
jgi:predicted dehydrogenase